MEIYRMNNLSDLSCEPASIDCFIFFFTEEYRSTHVLKELLKRGMIISKFFALTFDNINISSLYDIATNVEVIKVGNNLSEDLLPHLKTIDSVIAGEDYINIGLDISSMPIPFFSQILYYLKTIANKNVISYYTEPANYYLTDSKSEIDSSNLFNFSAYAGGVEMKTIPGYNGRTTCSEGSKRVLFYILGFELEYLNKKIKDDLLPDKTIPLNGFPAYFPKYKDISLINNNINYFESDTEIVFAEANHPFSTFNQLTALAEKYNGYCIDILPAGSKPMALGACLFALQSEGRNDIRLIFPYPTKYNKKQSYGSGIIWEYCL